MEQTTPQTSEEIVRHAWRNAKLLVSKLETCVALEADTSRGRIWLGSGGTEETAFRAAHRQLFNEGWPVPDPDAGAAQKAPR